MKKAKGSPSPPKYDYYNPSTWIIQEDEDGNIISPQTDADADQEKISQAATDSAFSRMLGAMPDDNEKVEEEKGDEHLYPAESEDMFHTNLRELVGAMKSSTDTGEKEEEAVSGLGVEEKVASPVRLSPAPNSPVPSIASNDNHSHSHSPIRLPFRKAEMKIFPDEEFESDSESNSDSSQSTNNNNSDGEEGFPGFEESVSRYRSSGRNRRGRAVVMETESMADQRAKERLDYAKREMAKHRAKFLAVDSSEHGDSHGVTMEKMMNPALIPVPDPPKVVNALGKDGKAAVWWDYKRDPEFSEAWVTQWDIKRYRLDADKEWRYKGTTILNHPHELVQNRTTVQDLENNMQYRFTATPHNIRGAGFESPHSDAVMVEAVLPPGWFRFWDEPSEKFFYCNIKTKQTSWKRPEEDSWYLDESLMLTFDQREMAHLKELYIEEMHHFNRISLNGFRRMMLESGEILGNSKVRELFYEYCQREQVTKWQEYMYVISTIKKHRQYADRDGRCGPCLNYTVWFPCFCYNEILSKHMTIFNFLSLIGNEQEHEKQKIGNWIVEWSSLGERYCYTHVLTHDVQWDTPEEVRFYLPKKMEDQLLTAFDPGDIEGFRLRFSHLDVDNSGFIDEHEFKLLLESMDINLSDKNRKKLIREIDLNGNGTIEFHEFCYMMLMLEKQKNGISNFWDQIRVLTLDDDKLQKVTNEMVAVTKFEEEHGNHDQRDNPHNNVRHKQLLQLDNINDEIVGSENDGSRVSSATPVRSRPPSVGSAIHAPPPDVGSMDREEEAIELPKREAYIDRITRKLAEEEVARQKELDAKSCLNPRKIARCIMGIGNCYSYTHQFTLDSIENIDKCINAVLCVRPPGEHGPHCLCGCRFLAPEEVTYPMWTDSKNEPLTWAYLCSGKCCND